MDCLRFPVHFHVPCCELNRYGKPIPKLFLTVTQGPTMRRIWFWLRTSNSEFRVYNIVLEDQASSRTLCASASFGPSGWFHEDASGRESGNWNGCDDTQTDLSAIGGQD